MAETKLAIYESKHKFLYRNITNKEKETMKAWTRGKCGHRERDGMICKRCKNCGVCCTCAIAIDV